MEHIPMNEKLLDVINEELKRLHDLVNSTANPSSQEYILCMIKNIHEQLFVMGGGSVYISENKEVLPF